MTKSAERKRGGVLRYRTLDLGNGKYVHIAVVRKSGPHGGHTIAGKIHKIKRSRFNRMLSNKALGLPKGYPMVNLNRRRKKRFNGPFI